MSSTDRHKAGNPELDLRPPSSNREQAAARKNKNVLVWGALSVVIMLGLTVLLVLPKLVSDIPPHEPATVSEQAISEADSASLSDTRILEKSRDDATQALQNLLLTRARLELANAPLWGQPEWSQAADGAARGSDLFGQGKFSMANEVFRKSLELLLKLESESGQRLETALDAGRQALKADDSLSATLSYETAIAIDPDNEAALNGLERSSVRPDILHLMTSAESALAKDDLQQAKAAYTAAVELDEQFEPAVSALQNVSAQIIDLDFTDAMSRALIALDTDQIETAELALGQAASLKPDEQVVHDTQIRLLQLRQKLWLNNQRQAATALERNEDWSGAVNIYRDVLAKVPQAAFARQGLEKAEDREQLHRQLDHYLSDPARVYSAQPLSNAEKLLQSAGQVPFDEPRLAKKFKDLQVLANEARMPMTVNLKSDGLTNVLIYHVGQLGTFTSHQLELPPGTYTVVGTRPGYRDVRQTFTVRPGSVQPALDIRCEEAV